MNKLKIKEIVKVIMTFNQKYLMTNNQKIMISIVKKELLMTNR